MPPDELKFIFTPPRKKICICDFDFRNIKAKANFYDSKSKLLFTRIRMKVYFALLNRKRSL